MMSNYLTYFFVTEYCCRLRNVDCALLPDAKYRRMSYGEAIYRTPGKSTHVEDKRMFALSPPMCVNVSRTAVGIKVRFACTPTCSPR